MQRARAEDWYATRTVGDGVTHIGERFVKEFYRCNIWHVRGRDRDLLIDSGMGVVPLRRHVPLVTERALTAVASHAHFDHMGGHHEFPDRRVHAAEAEIMAAPTRRTTLADAYVSDAMFERLPPAPYDSASYAVQPAPATRLLAEGDILDLGDRVFEVIHTPGHSPGGIALWEAASGILFTGDVVFDGALVDDNYHSDVGDYIRSMERLLDIPVRVVHAGHFRSYDGARHRRIIRDWLESKGR